MSTVPPIVIALVFATLPIVKLALPVKVVFDIVIASLNCVAAD